LSYIDSVQGITLSAGGVFFYVRNRAGAKRKPPHTAKIFVPEAKDGKLELGTGGG